MKKSGFLDDYSRLEPGGEGDPLLYYVKPGLDLSGYHKIRIDPVTIRAVDADALKTVPMEELDHLVKLFYDAVRSEIGDVRQIVSSAGAKTLRLRLAITEVVGSSVGNDVVSLIHPVGLVTNVGSLMTSGTQSWVSRVSIEGVLTDSSTGEILVEFVDRRTDGERFEGGEWTQVAQALKFWAVAMRRKLNELSGVTEATG